MKQMLQKTSIKKLIAAVLAIIMVVGILPSGNAKASTEATEPTVYGLKDISGQTEVVHNLAANRVTGLGTLPITENVGMELLVTHTSGVLGFGFGEYFSDRMDSGEGYLMEVVKLPASLLYRLRIRVWKDGEQKVLCSQDTELIPETFKLEFGVQTNLNEDGTLKSRKVYMQLNNTRVETEDTDTTRKIYPYVCMRNSEVNQVTLKNLAKEVSSTEILSTETHYNMPVKTIEATVIMKAPTTDTAFPHQNVLTFENPGSSNADPFVFLIRREGKPYIYNSAQGFSNGYDDKTFDSVVCQEGVVMHFAFVQENTQLICYANGSQVGSMTMDDTTALVTGGRLVIGGTLLGTSKFLRGTIQDVKLYSDARTADEIKADMTTLDKDNLITYYDFGAVDENSYTIQDLSGNGKYLSTSTSPFKLTSAQATLTDSLAMKYTLDYTNGAIDLQNAEFKMNGEPTTPTVTSDGNNNVITFSGMRAQNMADTIEARFYDGDKYAVYNYSMMDYMKALLDNSSTSASMKNLIVDMMKYGAAVQAYRGDNNTLAPYIEAYSTYDSDDATMDSLQGVVTEKLTGTSQEGDPTWKGVSLNLKDKVNIRCRLEAASVANLSVRVYKGDTLVETVPSSSFIAAGNNTYYLDFDEIYANEYASTFTFKFFNGETEVGKTLNYSVNTYLNAKKDVAGYTELLQAIHAYGSAAESVTQ